MDALELAKILAKLNQKDQTALRGYIRSLERQAEKEPVFSEYDEGSYLLLPSEVSSDNFVEAIANLREELINPSFQSNQDSVLERELIYKTIINNARAGVDIMDMTEFDGKQLVSVNKGELDLGDIAKDEDAETSEDSKENNDKLIERIKAVLDDKVKEVRTTNRLTSSPACLVADEGDMGRHLEQILKASGQAIPGSKPILEINPEHAVVKTIQDEQDEERFKDWSHILFDQALLSEGGQLNDPAGFVHRLNSLITQIAK